LQACIRDTFGSEHPLSFQAPTDRSIIPSKRYCIASLRIPFQKSKIKKASIMPNLASSLKTIIAEQLDVSVESVRLFPGSLPSLVKQLMQMKVTDTARLKEHLKLDKAGIPSLTAALLEVCISRHPFLVRDYLIDGG
jgi:hypothetical protein